MARLAVGSFMGQQRVEHELERRVRGFLPADTTVEAVDVGGLRSASRWRAPLRAFGRSEVFDRAFGDRLYRGFDLVHRMDGRLPPARHEMLTLHDMAFLHYKDEGQVGRFLHEQARRARFVVTVSEFSAAELRREWGLTNVEVVPNGCDATIFDTVPLDEAALGSLGVQGPFFLVTGGDTERKNLPLLRQAWSRFVQNDTTTGLVLAGPDTVRRRAIFAGLPRVHHAGFLSREVLLQVMASARALVVPSLYEGFGLPVVEAMAMGTAVLATDRAALPEVAGDDALLVPPDPEAWSRALQRLSSDDDLVAELGAAGPERARLYSWETSARRLASLYERC